MEAFYFHSGCRDAQNARSFAPLRMKVWMGIAEGSEPTSQKRDVGHPGTLNSFNFSRGRLGRGIGLFIVVGTGEAFDAFLESLDSLAQAFTETRQLAGSKDKQRDDKNHYQMPGL
jgi:hypothetical protein